ncbi:thioredoxin-dependent thiol peroxidase [Propionibacteriaceae bacterium G1746]
MSTRLEAGSSAPEFTLPDAEGNEVSLADFPGQRVIVYFYPAALTPGCTTQAVDFSTSLSDLAKAGYTVLGISPDTVEKLEKFAEKESLGFPLLSDPGKQVIQAYDAWGTRKLYGKDITGVLRSTFVITVDEQGAGTVELAQYNVKATGHVDRLRRELGI